MSISSLVVHDVSIWPEIIYFPYTSDKYFNRRFLFGDDSAGGRTGFGFGKGAGVSATGGGAASTGGGAASDGGGAALDGVGAADSGGGAVLHEKMNNTAANK